VAAAHNGAPAREGGGEQVGEHWWRFGPREAGGGNSTAS